MSRPRKQAYRSQALSDLTRQLLYSPSGKRAEVVRHAEHLHDDLEPGKNYPIDFVVYRLTDRRIPPSENVMLVGEAIKPDLRLLIDALSRSIEMKCGDNDPGLTTKELAESLGVSTKTIARWRDNGLRWRWGIREQADKPMVLIPKSALDAFQQTQPGRVTSATAFTRLSENEKSRLIHRARRLAEATDIPPQTILAHLSKRTSRSIEAIRQLIHRHDEAFPDQAVFTDRTGPLTGQQKIEIDDAYSRGITVAALCGQFRKTRSTIYRAIHEGQARRISVLELHAVYSPIFDREDADEVLMRPIVRRGQTRSLGSEIICSLPDKVRSLYDRSIQPDDVVRSLIIRYNFQKYRAVHQQELIKQGPPRASDLRAFNELYKRIQHSQGEVVAAMLPVTLSLVLRQQTAAQRDDANTLIPILFLANEVLAQEIDRFDASVAHTFESVLTNRLLRVLARTPALDPEVDEAGLLAQLARYGVEPA
ncbi:MAG: helix-turn-helix domain-containing protein [Planctomycetota bacterium]